MFGAVTIGLPTAQNWDEQADARGRAALRLASNGPSDQRLHSPRNRKPARATGSAGEMLEIGCKGYWPKQDHRTNYVKPFKITIKVA